MREPIDWTPEWSRRCRGFPAYAALRELGKAGVEELVDHCAAMVQLFAEGVAAIPGAELIGRPVFNQALVRFRARDTDVTRQIITETNRQGDSFFSASTWRGQDVMRVSVCNWRTGSQDIEIALRSLRHACTALQSGIAGTQ